MRTRAVWLDSLLSPLSGTAPLLHVWTAAVSSERGWDMGKHVMKRSDAGKDRATNRLRLFGDIVNILAALAKFVWILNKDAN